MGIGKALLLVPLVLGLNGCLGLWGLDAVLPDGDEPEQLAEAVTEPEPEPKAEAEAEEEKQDFFGSAVSAATGAAEATQTAKSFDEWRAVAALWQQAVDSMAAVPPDDESYSVAQQKTEEYQANLNYAKQNAGLTAVPYTVINAAGGDMRRKKAEAYIAAPTAVTRDQRAETAIKAARELRQQQGADVISVFLEPNPEEWGKGGAVAIARYAPDGKGYGQNDWTWEVEATGEPIDAVFFTREPYPAPTQ
jgi:hypothetical protein